jgi:hypothetical protein
MLAESHPQNKFIGRGSHAKLKCAPAGGIIHHRAAPHPASIILRVILILSLILLDLDSKGGATLYYTDTVHAATGYNDWLYEYDANGNMVTRVISPTTYTLVYDAENRLVKVHGATENQEQLRFGNPSQPIAEYTYNGDGQMVKAVEEGRVTVYVGNYFEACLVGCQGKNPTPTPTATATSSPTVTRTATPTATGGATESTGEASTRNKISINKSKLADTSPQHSTATPSVSDDPSALLRTSFNRSNSSMLRLRSAQALGSNWTERA